MVMGGLHYDDDVAAAAATRLRVCCHLYRQMVSKANDVAPLLLSQPNVESFMKILFCAVAMLSLAVTSACVPDGTAARGPQGYSAAASTQPPAEFLLGSGDRVRINVFGAEQISGEYQVDLSGGLAR